jgi:hypothetical protein
MLSRVYRKVKTSDEDSHSGEDGGRDQVYQVAFSPTEVD